MINRIVLYIFYLLILSHSLLGHGQELEVISQNHIKSGERVSIVLRFLTSDGVIDSTLTATITLTSGLATMENSTVEVVRGMGSISTIITSSDDFDLSVSGYTGSKHITIKNNPSALYHSGVINNNQTWDKDQIHIITDDLFLSPGNTLTILPGTLIYLAKETNIEISGRLIVLASADYPVLFSAGDIADSWGGIELLNGSENSELRYVIFTAGGGDDSRIIGHSSSQAVLKVDESELHLSNCFFIDNEGKAIGTNESINHIENALISRCDTGAEFRYSNTIISGLYVLFIPDEDDLIDDNDNDGLYVWDQLTADPQNTIIEHVVIYGTEDEGIDFNSQAHIHVDYSFISNCYDKGLSVGNQSQAEFHGDIITDCGEAAVGVKDNSVIKIENCTLYNNKVGLLAYTKNQGGGGGNIDARNMIISQSGDHSYSEDANSDVQINYSLSDTDIIPGNQNLMANPLFVAPDNFNFSLGEGSPAIDSGDPTSNPDPDGTRRDMGAVPTYQELHNSIILSEISYWPLIDGVEDADLEFIELYNYGDQSIDLKGFTFTSGISFTFPDNSYISAGEYLLIVKNESKWTDLETMVYQWESGSLSNSGERIVLEDDGGQRVFSVSYGISSPWPVPTSYYNYSIELKEGAIDHEDGALWFLSHQYGGSPGQPNQLIPVHDIVINEFMASNNTFISNDFGDFSDWIELYNPTNEYQNIAGAYLSNDYNNSEMSQVPETDYDLTTIEPGGFLLFWADGKPDRGVLHTSFKLLSQGGEVALSQSISNATSFLNQVSYDRQYTDLSYGRYPDGGNYFEVFSRPTPGTSNRLEHIEQITGLYINEFVAKYGELYPDEYGNFSDWIEIYNGNDEAIDLGGLYMTDDLSVPDKFHIPVGYEDKTTILAKGFLVFRADKRPDLGCLHLDFELSSHGEEIGLSQRRPEGMVFIDQLAYSQQTSDVSLGRYPDGGNQFRLFDIPTPGTSNSQNIKKIEGVYINEIVSNHGSSYADEYGNYSDWIELYNSNDVAIDLGGLYLTDVLNDLQKWQIPEGSSAETMIQARSFIVLWADGNPSLGPLHLDFQLRSQGEAVGLAQKILTSTFIIDSISFGVQSVDVSYGRNPDGGDHWEFFEVPTPGESNSPNYSQDLSFSETSRITVYPNPAREYIIVNITLKVSSTVNVSLYSLTGKKVADIQDNEVFLPGETQVRLDFLTYPQGVYLLCIDISGQRFLRKIITTSF